MTTQERPARGGFFIFALSATNMDNKGLLFIPDISGFSRFVTQTEIGHSRQIIQELLELLINANELALEISEIEGDAILFYRFGEPPSLEALYSQVQKMFCAFHENLLAYEVHRYCQCKACMSAKELTLKVVTHYGEFVGYNVRNFQKLIGKDLIVAHQLLKNDIPEHEYWIITRSLSEHPLGLTQWMRWDASVKHAETGDILFHYTQLRNLREELRPAAPAHLALENMTKVFSVSKDYETDIITLFHAVGDFQHRSKWQEGVQEVTMVNHYLPRVGMKCQYIVNGKQTSIYSSSYCFGEERIEFTETEESEKSMTRFTLQTLPFQQPQGTATSLTEPSEAAEATRLTLDYYVRTNVASQLMFKFFQKRAIEKHYVRSLENLVLVVLALRQAQGPHAGD